jgi:hypothetical protein
MNRRMFLASSAGLSAMSLLPVSAMAQPTLNGVKMANGMYTLVMETLPAGAARETALVGMRGALLRGGTTLALAEALPVIAGVAIAATVGLGLYALIDPNGFGRLIEAITSGGIGDIFQIPLGKIATTSNWNGGNTSYMRGTDFPAWQGVGTPYPDTNLDGWGLIYNSSDFTHRAYAKAHAGPLTAQDVAPLARAGSSTSVSTMLATGPLSEPAAQQALVAETIYQTALSLKAANPSLSAWVPVRPVTTVGAAMDRLAAPLSTGIWPSANVAPTETITTTPTPTSDVGAFAPPNLTVPEPRKWWDEWLAGLAPTKPVVPAHQSVCPAFTFNWFDGQSHSLTPHCQFFAQSQSLSRTVSTIGALITAYRIVMDA